MRYLLIDSSGLFSIQYFGMQNAKPVYVDLQGRKVNVSALYGYFYNGYARLLNYFNIPNEQVIHVLDNPQGSAYRKAIYPEYKQHRKEKEPEFVEQYAILPLFLHGFDENVVQQDGVEADDLIGSLVKKLTSEGHEVVIFSKDKDFFQLLGDGVEIVREEKREEGKVFAIYTKNYVQKEYGFSADSFVDYLALIGDVADNIPGVKGVGDKMARQLLVDFINIERLYANLDKVAKKRQRELLEQSKEFAFLSKRLVAIQKDLQVEFVPNKLSDSVKMKLQTMLNKVASEMANEAVDM